MPKKKKNSANRLASSAKAGKRRKWIAPPQIEVYDKETKEMILVDSPHHIRKGRNKPQGYCHPTVTYK